MPILGSNPIHDTAQKRCSANTAHEKPSQFIHRTNEMKPPLADALSARLAHL